MSLRLFIQRKTFTRRSFLIGGAKLALTTVLAARLYYLQILHNRKYQGLAEDNRLGSRFLNPERGLIYDSTGTLLANNKKKYHLAFVSKKKSDLKTSWPILQELVEDLKVKKIEDVFKESRKDSRTPYILKPNLSFEDIVRIENQMAFLPGMSIETHFDRFYPFGPLMVSVLGYIGPASTKDLEDENAPEILSIKIGKSGLEKFFDLPLRGEAGLVTTEVNAKGIVVRELEREESKRGDTINLTIDHDIQELSYQKLLEHQAGATVTVNIKTGAVLALTSCPTFDPHIFISGISKDNWTNLMNDPLKPLNNRALSGLYPPGSIFKTIVALAALEGGHTTLQEKILCKGYHEVSGHKFHCWKSKGGHGPMDLESSLEHSCDVYFYVIAARIGIDALEKMSRRFGLGELTGLGLIGEKKGLIPSRSWKMKVLGKAWNKGETITAGIGQSYILATPLQLAVMLARIVGGGNKVVPHLSKDYVVNGQLQKREEGFDSLNINPLHLQAVKNGLIRVVNSPFGTAYKSARITEKGFEIGGKTSTAQVRRISLQERKTRVLKNEEVPWKDRDHAMFFGFGPIHDPEFVTAVIVEHGGGGSRTAAPLAKEILLATQKKFLS
jgi:penicillin-binding protein 2